MLKKKTKIRKAQGGISFNSPSAGPSFASPGLGNYQNPFQMDLSNFQKPLNLNSNLFASDKAKQYSQHLQTMNSGTNFMEEMSTPNYLRNKVFPNISGSATGGIPKKTTKLAGLASSSLGGIAGMAIGTGLNMMKDRDKDINNVDATGKGIRDSVNNMLLSGVAGPWGMAAGAANILVGKLGGNTDASKGLGGGKDALNMIASFTPGLGFFTSKINPAEKSLAFQKSSGFSGLHGTVDKANQNAGKILFGRGTAKRRIADAQSKIDTATGILNTADQSMTASTGSADMFRLRQQLGMTDNSYLYNGALMAQAGGKLNFVKNVIKKFEQGKKTQSVKTEPVKTDTISPDTKFEKFRETLPLRLQDTEGYRLRMMWDLGGKPKDYGEAKQFNLFQLDEDTIEYHGGSVIYDNDNDEFLFLKPENHPSIQGELDWYNSDAQKGFREKYVLDKSGEIWKYVNRLKKKFRTGGKINVIPEGALHAHKHHLNSLDGITKKGIPVVTKEGGGVVQHAEIERDEIILRKELTEKLEELWKDGSEEAMIKAGKLLTYEIIENTEDNTGIMKKIKI